MSDTTVIAVTGMTHRCSIQHMVNVIAKIIKTSNIQGMNFVEGKTPGSRTFYFRLLEDLDAKKYVKVLNGTVHNKRILRAHIAKNVPNLQISKRPKMVAEKVCRKLGLTMKSSVSKMMYKAAEELMFELYDRFPGLLDLNKRTEHRFAYGLYNTIFARIKDKRGDANDDVEELDANICSYITAEYRSGHPHHTDFALVEECLQGARGATQLGPLTEEILMTQPKPDQSLVMETIPLRTIRQATAAYSSQAADMIMEHIGNLEIDIGDDMTEEDWARITVRQELKNLSWCIHELLRKSMTKHFTHNAYTSVRIYGIPCLPADAVMKKFLRMYKGKNTITSNLFNSINVEVSRDRVQELLAEDGVSLDGYTLLIKQFRPSVFNSVQRDATAAKLALENKEMNQPEEENQDKDMNQPEEDREYKDMNQTEKESQDKDMSQPEKENQDKDMNQPEKESQDKDMNQPTEDSQDKDMHQPEEESQDKDMNQPEEESEDKDKDMNQPEEKSEEFVMEP